MPDKTDSDWEIEERIMLLDGPFGDEQHVRERERAAQWLVDHAEDSYPVLIAHLNEGRVGAGAVAVLPRFARPESIPILERLLTGPEEIAWQACQALAQHPQLEAGEVLRQALAHSDPALTKSAADGLGARGDRNDCAALVGYLDASNAGVRYRVLQAVAKLGCVSQESIRNRPIAEKDFP